MMQLTIKTLDSKNHTFSVEDEATVAELKKKIHDTLGFELDSQRLIFCGRVLEDDQVLKESGIDNGKCLHLVQRPPPIPPLRQRDIDWMEGDFPFEYREYMTSPSNLDQQMSSISPTIGRIGFIRRIMMELRESLGLLHIRAENLVPTGAAENEAPTNMETGEVGAAQALPEDAVDGIHSIDEEESEIANASADNASARGTPALDPRFYANPRDLAEIIEELDQLNSDFAPYREHYVSLLRNLTEHNYGAAETLQRQDVLRLICDIMHSFAHCYHSISDITFNLGVRYPRLTSDPPRGPRRHHSAQGHINVAAGPHSISIDRLGTGAGAAAEASSASSATAGRTSAGFQPSTARPAAPPPAAPDGQTASETFNVRRSASTDRTLPIHTSTRTFTRPSAEGSGYQIGIETRGHIAIPLDNNLLSSLAAVTSNLRQAQEQHDQAIADVQPALAAATAVRPESDPVRRHAAVPPALLLLQNSWRPAGPTASTAPTTPSAPAAPSTPVAQSLHTQRPANDPVRETLRRVQQADRNSQNINEAPAAAQPSVPVASTTQTPSRSLPRIEAVSGATYAAIRERMAMERNGATPQAHPHIHIAGVTRQLDQPADGSGQRPLMDLENFMRNLSGGVGMELVMSMEELPNFLSTAGLDADVNDQAGVYVTPLVATHNVGGTPTADLLQNIVAIVRNRMVPQGSPQNQGQSQNRGQGQTQNHGHSENQGADAERRNHGQGARRNSRRRARERTPPYGIGCIAYDRYLGCSSVHSRQHLQERRDQFDRQLAEQGRPGPISPHITQIRFSNRRFTSSDMRTMMRLLDEPVSEHGQLHALLVAMAREVFLSPRSQTVPSAVPAEFSRVRIQLRDYVQQNLTHATNAGRRIENFENFADFLITQSLRFLHTFPTLLPGIETTTVPIDPIASVHALTRARLPSVVACIMSDATTDVFAARFYSVIYRFVGEILVLLKHFSDNIFDVLMQRVDDYMAIITEDYGTATRNWLRILAHEILVASRRNIESSPFDAREFFRHADGSVPQLSENTTTASSQNEQRESMDVENESPTFTEPEPELEAEPQRCSENSSATVSPSHSRSEPQPEEEELSVSDSVTSEPSVASGHLGVSEPSVTSESSPFLRRRWFRQSPSDTQSLASDLTSESHPPGIVAIGLTDTDSLCDVEELDVGALVDDINPFVCEYTDMRTTVNYSPLNIIEDDSDNVDDKGDEVDIMTVEEDLHIRLRREKRERSIRKDLARRRLEGNVRHKRFITMEEAEMRLDLRAMQQSAKEMDRNTRLRTALDRVVEERRRLEEEQSHSTDEEHEETCEDEDPSMWETISEEEDSSTLESDEAPDPVLQRMVQERDRLNAELETLYENPLLRLALLERLVSLHETEEWEAAGQLAAMMRQHGLLDEIPADFEFLYTGTILPLRMSQLNIHDHEFLIPVLVPQSNDTASDVNDYESYDYSSAAPAAVDRPARDENDWYIPSQYRYPFAELSNDGYYSPQYQSYRERPGFLTPQPIQTTEGPAVQTTEGPAATTESVSDLNKEYDNEGRKDFDCMDANLPLHTLARNNLANEEELSVPEDMAMQTLPPIKKDRKKQVIDIAENVTPTSDAATTGYHNSDDLNFATPMEDQEWRDVMDSSWEPVLREDRAAQARAIRPPMPFSDAYLSGMPPRKRRCLNSSRPEPTLDALMTDGLRGASEGVPGGLRGGQAELRQMLRDSVRDLVAARVRDQPEDYEPTRYPNTAAFLASRDRTSEPENENATPP